MSPNQLFLLDCTRDNIQPGRLVHEPYDKVECVAKGFLTSEGKLTEKAVVVLDEFETLLVKTKKKVATTVLGDEFISRVQEYREMFPTAKLPSGELPRQSVQELRDKFVWFFKTYPYYDWDLVLDATEYYIMTKRKENWAFMRSSSNFIKKTNPQTKETTSTLADHCQYLLDNPETV